MAFIDLRSDTVTQPTDAMRHAMAAAVVGDDVFGEDPTVRDLEERVAALFGMEAGLFVPSGTMANQIALWVHTGRDGQVIAEENSHIALYEGGAAALLCGATVRTVKGSAGVFVPDVLPPHVYPEDAHFARTKVVALENTHNWSGGRCWSVEQTAAVVATAHRLGLRVHIDAARLLHAAVATGRTPEELVAGADSAFMALSKGLSAPVGSVLCGSTAFIKEAHRVRKLLGGGMRQAGVLAAAGLIALEAADRLAEDHANAARLAAGLARVPQLSIQEPQTNMVLADVTATGLTGMHFCELMKDAGVGCLPRDMGPVVRFVTHRHISGRDVDEAARRVREVFVELAGG